MYKIYGLNLGEKESEASSHLFGSKISVAYYMWCIQGEGVTLMVDTGLRSDDVKRRKLYNVRTPESLLSKLKVNPAEITTVIVTHLHSDHFSAHELFPKARFYVQKADVEFFTGPATAFKQFTKSASNMVEFVKLAYEGRVVYLDGDAQILPGIRVALVGGHTPGCQAVVVNTRKGDVVLCADAVDLYRNLEENVGTLGSSNLLDNLLSYDKMRALASSPDLVIPGHDPLVMKKFPNPADGVVEIG